MTGHGDKLGRRQELAIAALLLEPTVEAAAKAARVAYSTLKSWLRQPSFQAAYREARREVLGRAVARLLSASGKAVERPEKNLDADNAQAANRAALGILGLAFRGADLLDLSEEIARLGREVDALEQAQADQRKAGNRPPWAAPPAPDIPLPADDDRDSDQGGPFAVAADEGVGEDAGPVAGDEPPLWS
jgi:hypothetical protein